MATNVVQNLIDSGLQFTEVQRKQAEKVVRDLVKNGEIRRAEAAKTVESLIERGRETSAQIAAVVKAEFGKQLSKLASRVDDLEDQLESIVSRFSGGGSPARAPSASVSRAPAKKAPAKKAAKKAPPRRRPPRRLQPGSRRRRRARRARRRPRSRRRARRRRRRPARRAELAAATVAARRRLDAELVRIGLATSRAHAQQLISESRVLVNGAVAGKPAHLVAASDNLVVAGPPARFVSRAGEKLDAALDHFDFDVTGLRVLDCGASTGGFTDCLLQRGAAEVVALDVGHGQLHPRIRHDERVTVLERTNVRARRPKRSAVSSTPPSPTSRSSP